MDFKTQFEMLTGYPPFPWQVALYHLIEQGDIPQSCSLPTGLGKTNVITIWLIAYANQLKVPRRLVYVVNRRTVVDQTTNEAEKLRDTAPKIGVNNLAISTLRGQYADNHQWSEDPSRPAIICGTVDMIGSRLLFSGYGLGLKARPLHAGFLGQDVLLVHDEAHLEPAFQVLIEKIQAEQQREKVVPWPKFRVMELTATRRSSNEPFELTAEEKNAPTPLPMQPVSEVEKANTPPIHHVWWRLHSKKWLEFKSASRDFVAKTIGETARDRWKDSGKAILVFVRTIDSVKNVVALLTDKQKGVPADQVQILTGTLRGYERDRVANPRRVDGCPVFARFLPKPKPDAPEHEQWKITPKEGTVFLVCTSAGEVGVDISADHLVCDLSPLDSMAQRFGRVNRRGEGDAQVDVIYETDPDPKRKDDTFENARWFTKGMLERIPIVENRRSVSPQSLIELKLTEEERDAAFTPPPTILPTTDILFDAWALTSIKSKLPGRPPVEPYLHGLPTEWQPAETQVAWREEVSRLDAKPWKEMKDTDFNEFATELLDAYPLKPHEQLKDQSRRVFDVLKKLNKPPETPVWLQAQDGSVERSNLGSITEGDSEDIQYLTIILPTEAGGLNRQGMLDDKATDKVSDVADEWLIQGVQQRKRLLNQDPDAVAETKDMHPVISIELSGSDDNESEDETEGDIWQWFELKNQGDKSAKKPVLWEVHVKDVQDKAQIILDGLKDLPAELRQVVEVAAKFHDHGKRRKSFQTMLGNRSATACWAKSGKKASKLAETYRHEFGSLLDVQKETEFLKLSSEQQKLVLHLIAVHHGRGRPHFSEDEAFDPSYSPAEADAMAAAVPQRFARLQRQYGRWGLVYIESLLRAADWAASANPSQFVEGEQ